MQDTALVQRVAAKAVIESEGAILILKPSEIDANRRWHIPGGIRDDISEPLISTATREVTEETEIDLSNQSGRVFKVGEWTAVDKGEEVKILAVFFHFRLPSQPKIVLSDEHTDFAWITPATCKSYDANAEVFEIVHELLGNG